MMSCDGGNEFGGGEYLEVLLILPMGHGGGIDDLVGIFDNR